MCNFKCDFIDFMFCGLNVGNLEFGVVIVGIYYVIYIVSGGDYVCCYVIVVEIGIYYCSGFVIVKCVSFWYICQCNGCVIIQF